MKNFHQLATVHLGWNYIGANAKAKAKILFDLCRYSSPPNVNTQQRNLCIHSKRYLFRFRVRSNIIPPLPGSGGANILSKMSALRTAALRVCFLSFPPWTPEAIFFHAITNFPSLPLNSSLHPHFKLRYPVYSLCRSIEKLKGNYTNIYIYPI